MSRRRSRREPIWVDLLPPVLGLLALGFFFVPGFRALVAGVFVLGAIAAGVALVGVVAWAAYRISRRRSGPESTPTPPLLGQSAQRPLRLRSAAVPGVPFPLSFVADSSPTAPKESLSAELLDKLEWRRFEEVVTLYFRKTGFVARRSRVGADGGVDILLSRSNEPKPFAYVQCKAWHAYKVGVKPVRELFGVMAAEQISQGYFVTAGEFTSEAVEFADGKALKLVTGAYLLDKLSALPQADQDEILKQITDGDYTTPTCPRCDIKMVMRHGPTGDFWGCPNFRLRWPQRCRQTFKLREIEAT
jgi:HJR/Mrr/RecB family endonuclease